MRSRKLNHIITAILAFSWALDCPATECPGKFALLDPANDGPVQVFEDLKDRNPALHRYLNSPAMMRWKRSADPGWKELREMFGQCNPESHCRLNLKSGTFSFEGGIHFTQVDGEDALVVSIDYVMAKQFDPELGEWVYRSNGTRTETLNATFPNLFGVLLEGVSETVRNNPQIRVVQVDANLIVNGYVIRMLKELGFESKGIGPFDHLAAFLAKGSAAVINLVVSDDAEMLAVRTVGISAVGVAGKRVRFKKGAGGQSFSLKLRVRDPGSPSQ